MSWFFKEGRSPISYSVPVEIALMTKGLANAIITDAVALMPIVLEKESTPIPIRKAETSNSHFGVINGRRRIK